MDFIYLDNGLFYFLLITDASDACGSCCQRINVYSRNSEILKAQGKCMQEYKMESGEINGKSYWRSIDEKLIIWYDDNGYWCIGEQNTKSCSFYSTNQAMNCPSEGSNNNWKYAKGNWMDVGNDFKVECLQDGMCCCS